MRNFRPARFYLELDDGRQQPMLDVAALVCDDTVLDIINKGLLAMPFHGGGSTREWLGTALRGLLLRSVQHPMGVTTVMPALTTPEPPDAITYAVRCTYEVNERGIIVGQTVTCRKL